MSEVRPYWDQEMQSLVIQETPEWIVSVTPMIYNHRICLTSRTEYPNSWTAAWCYATSLGAHLAALTWDIETQHEPEGFIKCAGDRR